MLQQKLRLDEIAERLYLKSLRDGLSKIVNTRDSFAIKLPKISAKPILKKKGKTWHRKEEPEEEDESISMACSFKGEG